MNPASDPPRPSPRAAAPPKKSSKRKWFILGGAVLVIASIVAAKLANRQQEKPLAVTTDKAVIRTLTQTVTATGKVQPEVEVKISPEVAGEIIDLPVKEGRVVKKGDLILKIRPDYYQALLEQEEANLAAAKASAVQAKAELLKAETDFQRSRDLHARNLISESDHTAAKTLLEVADAVHANALAQIRRTEGSLRQARDQLGRTVVYAPMDGTISSLSSEIGERVVAQGQFTGTEVMRVADLDRMELRVKVNENDIVNVKVGDHAVISIDAYPDRKFSGTVREIGASADSAPASGSGQSPSNVSDEVTNFLVKIRIADRDVQLRPGMSATADIETETVENVVAVPIQSVTVRAGDGLSSGELQQKNAQDAQAKSGNHVDVKDERAAARRQRERLERVVFIKTGDAVHLRKVETGIADNTYIEVKSGVKAGDEIVSGSYTAISRTLKDGMKVRLDQPKKGAKQK